jgi:mono/diheme cytochrome c family protein
MSRMLLRSKLARVAAVALVACNLVSCMSTPEPRPIVEIRASEDPQIVERGRYLVYGPAHCASCHGDPALEQDLLAGREVPLSGDRRFDLGLVGTLVAPNITSDPVAGIGALSDDMLVRSLRYGVSHTGRPLAPLMPFAELADRDLQSIISFLRTVAPVPEPAPRHELSWFGSFAINVLLEPLRPASSPPPHIQPERTAEYGRYLAHTVANCHGCHTQRSKLTGAFVGTPFAGGMKMREPGGTFVTPNLTPISEGIIRRLSEQDFVERFRARAQLQSRSPIPTPMPWPAYARMTDDDLGAIYRYLRTLPPSPTPRG